jgi:hypothetical protein
MADLAHFQPRYYLSLYYCRFLYTLGIGSRAL